MTDPINGNNSGNNLGSAQNQMPSALRPAAMRRALPMISEKIKKAGKLFRQAVQQSPRTANQSNKNPITQAHERAHEQTYERAYEQAHTQVRSKNKSSQEKRAEENQDKKIDKKEKYKDEHETPDKVNDKMNMDTAATKNTISQTEITAAVSETSSASPAELSSFITKVSQKIMLSRADGAQNASLRIQFDDSLLPQTQLTAQKLPDGSLNLTFTTNNPQAASLLHMAQTSLIAHMQNTQNLDVKINLRNEQGQPLQEQMQEQADQQKKKSAPDWDQVEAHVKKL